MWYIVFLSTTTTPTKENIMKEARKLFNRLVEEYEAQGGREASIDFTVNGVDFTLSTSDGVLILWYDDEPQAEDLFSTDPDDREGLIRWLDSNIGEAIQ
jgi:hypothetical protein